MKIKSLLLGSAAALVAVSGARAADAVVIPEPEAVEYVRVCDAAGAGYFYIPGSETCLKISGYVRYQISGNDASDGWDKDTEGRVLFQSWTDSEYGAVTTNIRIDANSIDELGAGLIAMDRAYITIGGLNMGLDTNAYDFDQDGAADSDTPNGTDRNQISYTADFGSGSFTLQLVEDNDNNYVPNVIAKAAFSFGDLGITAAIAYDDDDATVAQAAVGTVGSSSWGAKVVATYGGFGAHVAYSSDPLVTGTEQRDYSADYDWVLGANYGFDATSKLNLNLGVVYAIEEAADPGDSDFVIGAEAKYALTDTFEVSARARYFEDNTRFDAVDVDGWDWRMRFTSSF